MHEKIHKFEAAAYLKFASGSVQMDITTTPSQEVQDLLSTPKAAKRLKISHTAEIADRP